MRCYNQRRILDVTSANICNYILKNIGYYGIIIKPHKLNNRIGGFSFGDAISFFADSILEFGKSANSNR